MTILPFRRSEKSDASADILTACSIEVMPRTAAKIDDFRPLLPAGTRVYVAHIEGTPLDDMVATARRLGDEGFVAMPHIPARLVADRTSLATWVRRYADEAGVTEALLLAGGISRPAGDFHSSMQLLESGLFDAAGFRRLHVAGHPEGNRDIDPDGSDRNVGAALRWKNAFAQRTDAAMALVTQFAFDAAPVIAWAEALRRAGIGLPIHVGVAGPAKLQTLIKFAVACGVGPSLKVLQRRALDVTRLVRPHEPTDIVAALARHRSEQPDTLIEGVHLFPLGGIRAATDWTAAQIARPDPASRRIFS